MVDTLDNREQCATIRHQLMNLLTVITGYAEIIVSKKDIDEDVKRQVSEILNAANQCLNILGRSRNHIQDMPIFGEENQQKVLVVDDDPMVLNLLSEVLAPICNVYKASSGNDALRLTLTHDFDLVILDYNLGPPLNGRKVYETLAIHQPEVAEKVVFITGGLMKDEDQKFIQETNIPCIEKPFHLEDIKKLLNR